MTTASGENRKDARNFSDGHLSDLYCDRPHSREFSGIPATTAGLLARDLAAAAGVAPLRTGILFAALLLSAVVAAGPAEAAGPRPEPRARVAAGPIIGGLAANNGYYAYGPYQWAGVPLPWSPLYGPALPVQPGCWLQRQRLWTEYGWRWRVAPICY